MNTSAPWSEINFELLSLQRGDHTLMVFVQKEIKKKKKLTTHTCMSCLHQLTPGCPSSMKMIKRYLNLNSKIKKKIKKNCPINYTHFGRNERQFI